MRHYVNFAGKDLSDFGFYAADAEQFGAPERVIESVKVPGRNGELTFSDGSFANVTVKYTLYGQGNIKDNLRDLRNHLNTYTGYQRLEDTFSPNEYRRARFISAFTPTGTDRKNAQVELEFDCMPQRFLKDGEKVITFTAGGTLKNDFMESRPLIRIYGTGTLTVNNKAFVVSSANAYTDVDSEIMDAYKGSTNCNGNVSGTFPTFMPGSNTIVMTSGVTKLEITPRWWTI